MRELPNSRTRTRRALAATDRLSLSKLRTAVVAPINQLNYITPRDVIENHPKITGRPPERAIFM